MNTLEDYGTYPNDVTDEEWEFCLPYLALINEAAPQRTHPLRAVYNALRWWVRSGAPWRQLPNDLPPWPVVYRQSQRWFKSGVFQRMVHDLRVMRRVLEGRETTPTAGIIDSRTLQSTPESGHRCSFDGAKKRKGSKMHIIVDTLGQLLALKTTPAGEQDRDQAAALVAQAQKITGHTIEICYADQGYTGEEPEKAVRKKGVELVIIKLPEAKRGFVLLPRRWVVERTFAWQARFRRLSRDYERLATTIEGVHWLAASTLMLRSLQKAGDQRSPLQRKRLEKLGLWP